MCPPSVASQYQIAGHDIEPLTERQSRSIEAGTGFGVLLIAERLTPLNKGSGLIHHRLYARFKGRFQRLRLKGKRPVWAALTYGASVDSG